MKPTLQFFLLSVLLTTISGCADSSVKAEEARVKAEEARVAVADADARVVAADAHVRAADARVRADEAAAEASRADARAKPGTPDTAVSNTARLKYVIPAGTLLQITLIDSLHTDKNSTGDHFAASLTAPVMVNDIAVLQKGTKVWGIVASIDDGGKVKGLAVVY